MLQYGSCMQRERSQALKNVCCVVLCTHNAKDKEVYRQNTDLCLSGLGNNDQ